MMSETASNSAPTPAEVDLSGRQLGDYRLLRRLGRGAMAEVYLAEQQSLKRQVAVKVLKADLARDDTYIQRFRREAQAAAALVDAHIVQIHEVGCVDGRHYIAQEYVRGQNLRQLVARHGPLEVPLAVSIMRQVAAALVKAGERGIVHRDIKPENIMLAGDGALKVADFGLARMTGPEATPDLTQVGITMGTPLYMSPEQIEGRPLDPRSDIYSFGVTCYQMLSGVLPFAGDTTLSIAVQHLKKQPERLENLRPGLPGGLCRIVHRMLAKDPEQRYPDALSLLRDLRTLPIEGAEDVAMPDAAEAEDELDATTAARLAATQKLSVVMRASQRRTFSRALLAVAGGLLLAFFVGLVAGLWSREPSVLAGAKTGRTHVPKQNTALAQYMLASRLNNEEGWLSVIEYFGDDAYMVARAKQQLARHYLFTKNRQAAQTLFEELAAVDTSARELQAFGLAGLYVVESLDGHQDQLAEILVQLDPLRGLLPPDMARMLATAIERNLGPQTPQAWQQWINDQYTSEP